MAKDALLGPLHCPPGAVTRKAHTRKSPKTGKIIHVKKTCTLPPTKGSKRKARTIRSPRAANVTVKDLKEQAKKLGVRITSKTTGKAKTKAELKRGIERAIARTA